MADKRFIGKTKDGKYPDQIEIGLQQKDIDLLQARIFPCGVIIFDFRFSGSLL